MKFPCLDHSVRVINLKIIMKITKFLAKPKSHNLTFICSSSKTLWDLMSLWTTCDLCRYSRADATSLAICNLY